MLTLGDVLGIFTGGVVAGEIGGVILSQPMWIGIAALMTIPIVMVVLSLTLQHPVNRRANIIVAIFFFLLNLIPLPSYPGAYDKF